MQLNTFPCVVEALHSTGVNIVRCAALGTTDVYITDDFGQLVHRNMGHLASVQHSMNSADVYAIINGIPADIIDLDEIVKSHSGDLECGTIACAFGWLGMHPVFKKLLRPTSRIAPDWTIRGTAYRWYVDAAAALFGTAYGDARSLFCAAVDSRYDHYHGGFNHKAMFLYRLESFLKENGQWNGLTDCKGR